jgi:hypothetical protein
MGGSVRILGTRPLSFASEPTDVEPAVLRLRRSYSVTPPGQLQGQLVRQLRQIQRLLVAEKHSAARLILLEAAAWLSLLLGTVQADLRAYRVADDSIRRARELARGIGQRDLEAWTWETAAWIVAAQGYYLAARHLASAGIEIAPAGGYGLVAVTMQRARISGAMGDAGAAVADLRAGERALARVQESEWVDDHYVVDRAKAAFFASGTMALLRRPAKTIEYAAEVIRANDNPTTRNYWPMRTSNARLEWAAALADQGEEEEAIALAQAALDPLWFRPDTEQRCGVLLARMRDARLKAELQSLLRVSRARS